MVTYEEEKNMNRKICHVSLYAVALCCIISGCDLPTCDSGDRICGNRAGNGVDIEILQHNRFSQNGSINETPCQIYNCIDDDYVEEKTCEVGSQFQDGALSCIPRCAENEVVCADNNEDSDEIQIIGENEYIPYTDAETGEQYKVYKYSCNLYKCVNDRYVSIETCPRGSKMTESGVVSCISNCWNYPKFRCMEDANGIAHVQVCNENSPVVWRDVLCDNACHFTERAKITGSIYKDGSYEAGECGKCRNDMDTYCDGDKLHAYSCVNGMIVESGNCPNTHTTLCGDKYVDIKSDRTNCGGCYMHCGESESCASGKCVEDSCETTGYMRYPLNGDKIPAFCISTEEQLKKVHDALSKGKPYPGDHEVLMQHNGQDVEGEYYRKNEKNAYILMNNIVYHDQWTPIDWIIDDKDQPLSFIGQNYYLTFTEEITNADESYVAPEKYEEKTYVTKSKQHRYSGVFGYIQNTTIDGLHVLAKVNHQNVTITDDDLGTADDQTRDTLGIAQGAGGFAGYMKNSIIQNSEFKGEVLGITNIGGIAGIADGSSKIINSHAHPRSTESVLQAAPYIGYSVKNQTHTPADEICELAEGRYINADLGYESPLGLPGDNIHYANLGGLVGFLYNASISDSSSTLRLEGANQVPLVGVGGLVGTMYGACEIVNSHRNADVNVAGHRIGGIVGNIYTPTIWTEPVIKNTFFAGYDDVFSKDATPLMLSANTPFNQIPAFENCNSAGTYYPSHSVGGLVGAYGGLGTLKLIHSFVNTEITAYNDVGGLVGISNGNLRIDSFMEFIESFNYIEYLAQAYYYLESIGMLDDLSELNLQDEKLLIIQDQMREFFSSAINHIAIHANHNAGGIIGSVFKDLYIANMNLVKDDAMATLILFAYALQVDGHNHTINVNAQIDEFIKSTRFISGGEERYPVLIQLDQLRDSVSTMVPDEIDMANAGGLIGIAGNDSKEENIIVDISNSFIAETVKGDSNIGGFIGTNHASTTINMFFTFADLIGNYNVGGVVGLEDSPSLSILNFYGNSDITVFRDFYMSVISIKPNSDIRLSENLGNFGGVIGLVSGDPFATTLLQSITTYRLIIEGEGSHVGGFIGSIEKGNSNAANCEDMTVDDIKMENIDTDLLSKYINCVTVMGSLNLNNPVNHLSGKDSLGGLVGYTNRKTLALNTMVNDLQITQTEAESDDTIRSVGGMFGTIANTMAIITRNYVSGEIKGHTAGGIIGLIKDSPLISIDSAITNVDITGSQYAGAVAGLVDIDDNISGLFTVDDLDINPTLATTLHLDGKYNGVSISKSGILGTVSNTESASDENIFSGGLYGQYTAHFNVVDNSYIYVALGPNAKNSGFIGGLMNVTVIQLLNDLYYWDQYPNFYGSTDSVIKPVIPALSPVQLPKPLPFIDFSLPDKTAKLNGGALIVDTADPSKNVTLYQDKDGLTNEIELKLYGIGERICKFVQYNSFHKSIRHSVEKLCQ